MYISFDWARTFEFVVKRLMTLVYNVSKSRDKTPITTYIFYRFWRILYVLNRIKDTVF